MITSESVLQRRDAAMFTTVEDTVLMMDIENGAYYELDGSAARIWHLLDTPLDFESLCGRLGEHYAVDDAVCRTDTAKFLQELSDLGLVTIQ